MAGSGDEHRRAPRAESDPLDDATAPYSIPDAGPDDDAAASDEHAEGADSVDAGPDAMASDTTTWAGPQAPPVLIEEETVVSPGPPDATPPPPDVSAGPPPELDATVVEAAPEPALDATVVEAAPEPDPNPDPKREPDATLVASPEEPGSDASPDAEPEVGPTVIEPPDAPNLFQPDPPDASAAREAPPGTSASAPLEEATVVATPPEPEPEPERAATVEPPGPPPEVEQTPAAVAASAPGADRVDATSRAGGETRGTIPPSSSLHPMLLERVEPSLGRGERLRLDAAHWHVRLGRAEQNDVRLYTASASREHAEIRGNQNGDWVLQPAAGKSVLVDGDAITEPIVLEVGMNLVMGGDHLRCVTEGLGRGEMAAPTAADGLRDEHSGGTGPHVGWWVIGAIAALGVAMIAFAWFSG